MKVQAVTADADVRPTTHNDDIVIAYHAMVFGMALDACDMRDPHRVARIMAEYRRAEAFDRRERRCC